jgi:antitoxin VapB
MGVGAGNIGIYLIAIIGARVQSSTTAKAKLFLHGRSQAVRLPKEFRFDGTEVFVRRVGDEVVLSSKPKAPMQLLVDALDQFEPGFELRREQPGAVDERTALLPGRRR